MSWPPILVRYGEIGIKSRSVRAAFERRLMERIEEQLLARGVEAEVRRDWGRVIVRASDVERALDALAHTFGIVSASPAVETKGTPDAIAEVVLGIMRERLGEGGSFAVRVRRSGTHTFTSLDVAKRCAERILGELADRAPRVDLDAPDVEVSAEIRENVGFVFTRRVRGPGGLPMGSQGRVAVFVDSPHAAHAAWLLAKRGSALDFFALDVDLARTWLAPLAPWIGEVKVRSVDAASRADAFAKLGGVLKTRKAQAMIVADHAGEAIARRAEDESLGAPVFRPLVGYAGARFVELARMAELPEAA